MKTAQYKYSKGDLVWRLKDRKAIQSVIEIAAITITNETSVRYYFESHAFGDSEVEEYLFDTKEELINSLTE